jgi:hypothetical protein
MSANCQKRRSLHYVALIGLRADTLKRDHGAQRSINQHNRMLRPVAVEHGHGDLPSSVRLAFQNIEELALLGWVRA